MRIVGKILTALLLLFSLLTALSTAEIISVKIRSDKRESIVFSKFQFSHTGYVSIDVSSVAISSMVVTSNLSQPDPSRIGFFLLSFELEDRYYLEFQRNLSLCPFDLKFISFLFTLQDLSPPPQSSFNKSSLVKYPNVYSLYFANCNKPSLVTMDVRMEMYNVDDDGVTKNYLSADLTNLPLVYFIFSVIYLCFLCVWISVCFGNYRSFNKMHLVMSVLLVITFLHFVSASVYENHIKVTGTSHGWDFWLNEIGFIRNEIFFVMIALLCAGWCFWKPRLLIKEILVLMIVILLQVLVNVGYIKAAETGIYDENWEDLTGCAMLADMISGFIVLAPICMHPNTVDMSKVVSFEVLVSMGIANAVVRFFLLPVTIPGIGGGMITVAHEINNLVFSMAIFYLFRPFVVDDEVEDGVELVVDKV